MYKNRVCTFVGLGCEWSKPEKASTDLHLELLVRTGGRINLADNPDLIVLAVVEIHPLMEKVEQLLRFNPPRPTGISELVCRVCPGIALTVLFFVRYCMLPWS
jgi:hypothetical protein